VRGFVGGTLHLVGTPIFRDRGRLRGNIVIRNLDYTIQTRSLLLRLGNRIFQRNILNRLRAAAEWDVTELAQAYNQVNQALNQQLTPEARLVTSLSTFRPGQIFVTARGVEADHLVSGQVSVVVPVLSVKQRALPGARSSEGLPAIVTRPDLVACLYCR
jgi:hypothetical protein